MSITIKVAGPLKQHIPPGASVPDVATVELIMEFEKEFNIAIPDDQAEKIGTVGQAIERLALPEVGSLLMLVNGQMVHWHTELKDGDTLELIPAICGGA